MCDIKKKTQLKTMTVYKVVKRSSKGTYKSAFAEALIKLGPVPNYDWHQIAPHWHNPNHPLHGNISGFAMKQDAISLSKAACFRGYTMKVLKIKLGGTILIGSAAKIADNIPSNHITYASNEILSIEEI